MCYVCAHQILHKVQLQRTILGHTLREALLE